MIEQAFVEHCKAQLAHQQKVVFGALLLCNLVWWPTDAIVFGQVPEHVPMLAKCRAALIILALVYLALSSIRALRPYLYWLFVFATSGGVFAAAVTSSEIGGPDTPYFHTLYFAVLATAPQPLTLPRRIVATAILAVATGAGMFFLHPEYLHAKYAYLCVSFLCFIFLVSTWFGHRQFILTRENFFQAAQLAEHKKMLEMRVAERTEELRRLLNDLETTREVERSHLSAELHDELGQELSALRYSLGLTKIRYGKEPTKIAANLDDLGELLERASQSIRNVVTDLRPKVIDDLGLEAAVEWLVDRTKQRSELDCHLEMNGDLFMVDTRIAIAAFRIVQESLTNVIRHAEASRVEVDLRANEEAILLRIADDGIGLDASRAKGRKDSSGVGLLGMRERVHALGGELAMGAGLEGRGTEIRCQLPRILGSGNQTNRVGGQA